MDHRCEAIEALAAFTEKVTEELAIKRIIATMECYKVSLTGIELIE